MSNMIPKWIQVILETICKYLFSEKLVESLILTKTSIASVSFDVDETKPVYWNEASLIGNLRPPLSSN